jgi:hypothetical protein
MFQIQRSNEMYRLSVKSLTTCWRVAAKRTGPFFFILLILMSLTMPQLSATAHLNPATPLQDRFPVTINGFHGWSATNQPWILTPQRNAVMTRFNPATHGFLFANTFTNDLLSVMKTAGLCGGMMYATMDYYLAGRRIPGIDYRPAVGTPLQTYLYDRQVTQLATNADRLAAMIAGAGPLANKRMYFEAGMKDETLRDLRAKIDAGTPAILALQNADNALGHVVLAIGYDMGRYRGDLGEYKEDLSIFVYDPNHPRETRILTPNVAAQRYVYRNTGLAEDPNAHWLTYFVDTRYQPTTAPTISEPNLGGQDGLIRELRLTIKTGADELVAGHDEVKLTVKINGRKSLIFENLNNRMRWLSDYEQTISLPLETPVRAADILSFELAKSARPGLLGIDNWDLECIDLFAYGGGVSHPRLFHADGHPLRRFTADITTFVGEIQR